MRSPGRSRGLVEFFGPERPHVDVEAFVLGHPLLPYACQGPTQRRIAEICSKTQAPPLPAADGRVDDGTIFAPTFSSLVHVAELVDVRVPPGIRFRLRRLGRGDDPVCVARGGVPHNPGAHRGPRSTPEARAAGANEGAAYRPHRRVRGRGPLLGDDARPGFGGVLAPAAGVDDRNNAPGCGVVATCRCLLRKAERGGT